VLLALFLHNIQQMFSENKEKAGKTMKELHIKSKQLFVIVFETND